MFVSFSLGCSIKFHMKPFNFSLVGGFLFLLGWVLALLNFLSIFSVWVMGGVAVLGLWLFLLGGCRCFGFGCGVVSFGSYSFCLNSA